MRDKLKFSQMPVEDENYLLETAKKFPAGSQIVEIGTAQGGSAFLFAKAISGKEISVFTYDICPSQEAYQNLQGLNVTIMAKASADGANEWKMLKRPSIDLLFIDGSHTFLDVYKDYHSWIPFLRPDGQLLFHDYDPLELGGIQHLGVKIFIDTLLRSKILYKIKHAGINILSAKLRSADEIFLPDSAYIKTWNIFKKNLSNFIIKDFNDWAIFGKRNIRNEFFISLLGGSRPLKWIENYAELAATDKILVLDRPVLKEIKRRIRRLASRTLVLDDLKIAYLVYFGLGRNKEIIFSRVRDRCSFFAWQEFLEMFDHAMGLPIGSQELFSVWEVNQINELSRICALELVRFAILGHIISTIDFNYK